MHCSDVVLSDYVLFVWCWVFDAYRVACCVACVVVVAGVCACLCVCYVSVCAARIVGGFVCLLFVFVVVIALVGVAVGCTLMSVLRCRHVRVARCCYVIVLIGVALRRCDLIGVVVL